MRLIDKNYVLEAVKALPVELDAETVQRCIEILSNQPTVDAVKVIRCKDCVDCRESTFDGRAWKYCETIGSTVNEDDYCCWAERKEE